MKNKGKKGRQYGCKIRENGANEERLSKGKNLKQ